MTPDVTIWLTMLGARAMAQAGRETDQLEASRWGLISAQAGVAAHEFENGAQWRMQEIETMTTLLRDAADSSAASRLASDLFTAAGHAPESLKITELDAAIESLRKALTALHEAAEALDTDEGRALEARIWSVISQSVQHRTVPGNLFDQ